MRHVADGNGVLLLDIGEEGALVVDLEVEDAVLVGELEGGGVGGGGVGGVGGVGGEREAVEGGEHGEFELEGVRGGEGERGPGGPGVFREGDCVFLGWGVG